MARDAALTSRRRRSATILAAALAGVALGCTLGAWQLRRAATKIERQQAIESREHLPALGPADIAPGTDAAGAQPGRAVRLTGRWVGEHTVYLENRQMDGRVGFFVVTPLQLDGRPLAVLVQRGWVPRDQRDRTLLPAIATPRGRVEIEGRIAPAPARLYEFDAAASGAIRQNLDVDRFAAEAGLTLAPGSVQQTDSASTAGDGLRRDWPRPAADVDRHYGYAFQWFALAALIAGLYVWFQLVRPRLARHAAP